MRPVNYAELGTWTNRQPIAILTDKDSLAVHFRAEDGSCLHLNTRKSFGYFRWREVGAAQAQAPSTTNSGVHHWEFQRVRKRTHRSAMEAQILGHHPC